MIRSNLAFFLGFGLLSACTGNPDCSNCDGSGTDLDGEDCASDCVDDTGDPPDPSATFVGPPVLFNAAQESCQTNLVCDDGASYTVMTDEEVEVNPASCVMTYGDQSLASSASDNLPLHLSTNGWKAIGPPESMLVKDGEVKRPSAPPLNLFIEGTWTCDCGELGVLSDEVIYTEGHLLYLPLVGVDIEVAGMTLSYDNAGIVQDGEFISNSWLYIESTGGMAGDYTADCWAGTADQDPR